MKIQNPVINASFFSMIEISMFDNHQCLISVTGRATVRNDFISSVIIRYCSSAYCLSPEDVYIYINIKY